MKPDSTQPVSQNAPSKRERFIEFVLDRARKDSGARANLARSFRSDGDITSDALWIIGGWLPTDEDRALIWARVAALCAKHSKQPQPPAAEQATNPFQWFLAGQLSTVNETSAQRLLEHITRDGLATSERLNHVARAIEICPHPERIDWAWLISDLERLSTGGDAALQVRIRWYRNYHRADRATTTSTTQGETPERNSHNG